MSSTRNAKELMEFVISAGGNLPLAAERAGVSKTELVNMITGDGASTLSDNLRAMLLLSIFDTIMQTNIAFRASLPTMSPDAISKAFASQLTAFAQLSGQATPELGSGAADANAAKRNMVTRLEQWKRTRESNIIDVSSEVDDVG